MRWLPALVAAVLALAAIAAPAVSQDKKEPVPRTASSDMVEKVLGDLKIPYEKSTGKASNSFFYNYERDNYKIRLGDHGGKLLWLSAAFPKAAAEQINTWNVRAKFSRAVLTRQGQQEVAVVESQLDCEAGVTPAIVRQFLKRFEKEVRDFDDFLSH
jgi:Putative bacterial sensory transduction regulator